MEKMYTYILFEANGIDQWNNGAFFDTAEEAIEQGISAYETSQHETTKAANVVVEEHIFDGDEIAESRVIWELADQEVGA